MQTCHVSCFERTTNARVECYVTTSSSPESAFLQELEYAKDELEKFKQQKERDATLAFKQSEANNHCERKEFR